MQSNYVAMLRVKEICKQRGVTSKELALRMDVTPEALSRMLSDAGNPTLSKLKGIAEALDMQVYELFDDFKKEVNVQGFLEIDKEMHRIRSFNDLKTLYDDLSLKVGHD